MRVKFDRGSVWPKAVVTGTVSDAGVRHPALEGAECGGGEG